MGNKSDVLVECGSSNLACGKENYMSEPGCSYEGCRYHKSHHQFQNHLRFRGYIVQRNGGELRTEKIARVELLFAVCGLVGTYYVDIYTDEKTYQELTMGQLFEWVTNAEFMEGSLASHL